MLIADATCILLEIVHPSKHLRIIILTSSMQLVK